MKKLLIIILAASLGFVCGVVATRRSSDNLVKAQDELQAKLIESKTKIGELTKKLSKLRDK